MHLSARRLELLLLVVAVAAAAVAAAAVGYGVRSVLPPGLTDGPDLPSPGTLARRVGLPLAAVALAAHGLVCRFAPHADPLLLPCVVLLNGLGLALITRLDLAAVERATQRGTDPPSGDAALQVGWTVLGVLAFAAVLVVVRDHTRLARYAYSAAAAGLVLLLLPAVPGIGRTVNGATLWVRVGPVQVQPSEAAKLLLIVFFAAYLVRTRDTLALASRTVAGLHLPRARDLGPILLAWSASLAVLVRERDLGSSLLFFGIFIAMLYVATERTSWLLIGVGLFAGGAVVAHRLFSHVQRRVDTWLDPFGDPEGSGFQLVQGFFSLGTGGLDGTGLGRGAPATVPYAKTDFILSALGEELGLVGVTAVLLVFLLLVSRGLRAAVLSREPFGALLAAGLSVALALQVFVIAGGVLGLIPLTGVTLPWLSYGGSSVVANWALVALLARVSDAARRPRPTVPLPSAPPVVAA